MRKKNLLFKIIPFFIKDPDPELDPELDPDPDPYVGSGSGQKSSGSATLLLNIQYYSTYNSLSGRWIISFSQARVG